MIVCVDDETEKELERHKKALEQTAKRIIDLVHISYDKQQKVNKEARQQNPYIVKRVIRYMAAGHAKPEAIILTALEFHTTVDRVKSVFWQQNRYMSAINLYARRYMAEKLKNAGLTAKEIAKIIGVSENHIFKMLRHNTDFWFLN
ncbi:MAG: hypothetical protein OSJ76_00390 [Alphaproteobacteria bacterium]|nr:hypothetical protein [Alphaproteobacteria bacterium]